MHNNDFCNLIFLNIIDDGFDIVIYIAGARMEVGHSHPNILVYDKAIHTINPLKPTY